MSALPSTTLAASRMITPCQTSHRHHAMQPLIDLHLAGTASCRSIPDVARRGAFLRAEKLLLFSWRLEAAFPRVRPHYSMITLLSTACETSRPSCDLAGGPATPIPLCWTLQGFTCPSRPFLHAPPILFTSQQRAVTAAKGDYNRCNDPATSMLTRGAHVERL